MATRAIPDAPSSSPRAGRARPLVLARWLFAVAALVVAMVVIGGITRLTESGLSITQWQPVTGAIPPLSEAAWEAEFALYRATPEYRNVTGPAGMDLAGFQFIYFWEWAHRQLGRVIGLAFALPLVWFWVKGMIPRGYHARLVALLALGGLQGAFGWVMVRSGLSGEMTDVSHFWLSIHLLTALFTLAGLVWTALDLRALAAGALPLAADRRGAGGFGGAVRAIAARCVGGGAECRPRLGQLAADERTAGARDRRVARDRVGADARPVPHTLPPSLVGLGRGGRARRAGAPGETVRSTRLGRDPCGVRHADPARHRHRRQRDGAVDGGGASGSRRVARRGGGTGRARDRKRPMVGFVRTTFADAATAEEAARALLEDRLIACANVSAPLRSVYRWNGAIETGGEVALLCKTRAVLLDAAADRLRALHPFETPAIACWTATPGDAGTREWIEAETRSEP